MRNVFICILLFTSSIFAVHLDLTKEEKAYLSNKKTLTVANLDTFPPFNFFENGLPKGYSVDYMTLVGKYIGTDITFISNKSWNDFLIMLKNKEIDIVPHVAVTPERDKYLDFTQFNHIEYTTGIAIDKTSNITSINDLKDKTIAVVNNSFIQNYLRNNFPHYTLLLVDSTQQALQLVSSGQADIAIGSLPALNYYIQKEWLSNVKTITIDNSEISKRTSLPIAVTEGNFLLKSILEKANHAIPHNEIVTLKQKWMTTPETQSNDLTLEETAYLSQKNIIKICVLPNWLPFEQIDEKGKHKGIGADIMKIISKYINTPIELVATKEWSHSLENIRQRKCDLLPVAMDIPSRRDAMNFTQPYVAEPFVIATKLDKLFVKDSQHLSNKKVGIVKSYAFIEVLKHKNPLIDIIEVSNAKEGLEKVSNGELFGYIDTMPAIGYNIQKYSMFDLKIAGKLESEITLSIASRNDEPLLNSIMQKALDNISEDQIRTIVGKWIEIKVSQEINYTRLLQVSALFLVILLVILYKNRRITKLHKDLIHAHCEINEQKKMVDKYVLILSINTKGIITEINEAYCKAIEYTPNEIIGKPYSILRQYDSKDIFLEEMMSSIRESKFWCGEIKNLTKNSELIWLNTFAEPIFKNDIKIGYRLISENITDKKRIEELSITDKLTSLYNRMKLDEIMLQKVENFKRHHTQFSIILLDIDNFKSVNDNFGHDVGDYLLKSIAKTLKDSLRITDTIGRWGGEEFVVICDNTTLKEATIAAENIRKTVAKQTFEKIGYKTISLGVAQFTKEDTISTLFKKVDNALYQAKTKGKNQTVVAEI